MHPRKGTRSKIKIMYYQICPTQTYINNIMFENKYRCCKNLSTRILPLFIAVLRANCLMLEITLSGCTLISKTIPVGIKHNTSSVGILVSSSMLNDSKESQGDVKKFLFSLLKLLGEVNLDDIDEAEEYERPERGTGHSIEPVLHSIEPVLRLSLEGETFLTSEKALSRIVRFGSTPNVAALRPTIQIIKNHRNKKKRYVVH